MEIPYKHQAVVDSNAWWLRFYLWLYEAQEYDVNFCKLFWGFVFCVPILILKMVFLAVTTPFVYIGAKVPRRKRKATRVLTIDEEMEELLAAQKEKGEREPSRAMKFLGWVGMRFSQLVMTVSSVWGWMSSHRKLNYVVIRLLLGLGLLAGLAAGAYLIYLLIQILSIVVLVVGVLAAVAVAALMLYGLKLVGFYDVVYAEVLQPVGHTAKRGGSGFGAVMRQGYIAVKSNTCPQIIVRDLSSENSDTVSP